MSLDTIRAKADKLGDLVFISAVYISATVMLLAGVYKLTRWFLS